MKKQIGWINIAKGVAIILVVYGHVLDGLNSAGYEVWHYQLIHDIIYSFHMPLFFFLSGIFAKKILELDFLTVLKNRLSSLLYPYFLWGGIQTSIMVILSKYTNGNIGFDRLLQLPIRPIGQFWYIYDLFFITLLYYIICKVIKNSLPQFVLVSILFGSSYLISFWEYDRITFHLLYFYLGSMFLNAIENWQKNKKSYLFGGLTVTLLLPLFLHLTEAPGGGGFLASLLGSFLVIAGSMVLTQQIVLEFLGRQSLAIYLWHILVISGLRVVYTKLLNGIPIELFIMFATGFGTIVPAVLSQLISKSKVKTIVFGR